MSITEKNFENSNCTYLVGLLLNIMQLISGVHLNLSSKLASRRLWITDQLVKSNLTFYVVYVFTMQTNRVVRSQSTLERQLCGEI
jgi:hypothetical protein